MFGDVEVVCDLDTYHHTVTCTCETNVRQYMFNVYIIKFVTYLVIDKPVLFSFTRCIA